MATLLSCQGESAKMQCSSLTEFCDNRRREVYAVNDQEIFMELSERENCPLVNLGIQKAAAQKAFQQCIWSFMS